jgi:hypothetical protein
MRNPPYTAVLVSTSLLLGLVAIPDGADARQVRNTTRTSVNRGANVNRSANVNRDVNVDRDVNIDRDIDVDIDHGHYHPVARAVGVTAAAVAIGSIVYSLPPSCTTTVTADITYQQCGNTWYQPQYAGTQVSYVVVDPP